MSERAEQGDRAGDWKLVRDHLAGDPDAYRALYEKYRDKVYATAFRVVGEREQAADLTQEIFVKIHRELSAFKFQSKFSTWLFRVSVNHAINKANEKDRHARIHDKIARDEGGTLRSKIIPTLPKFDERVQQAIGHLSPKLRAIVALRYLEGLSYDEISDVLDISIGTVKSRLFLAHETLRPILTEFAEEMA